MEQPNERIGEPDGDVSCAKKNWLHAKKKTYRYKEACPKKQARFVKKLAKVPEHLRVFADETGIDDNESYAYGRSPKGGRDYYDEESQNRCVQYSMHDELDEAIEAYIDRLLFIESHRATEEEATRNKEAYPVSRKRNVENAEAVFFVKILNRKFLFFFGKPYHDHIATFINAAFGTCYDYAAIAQIVRKR